MSSGSFQFRYNHTNENAAWHTNPNAKFILPEEDGLPDITHSGVPNVLLQSVAQINPEDPESVY